MSNDRIYLVCKSCGKKGLLGKYWGVRFDGWDIMSFSEEHVRCSPNFGLQTLKGDECFKVETESGKTDPGPGEGAPLAKPN